MMSNYSNDKQVTFNNPKKRNWSNGGYDKTQAWPLRFAHAFIDSLKKIKLRSLFIKNECFFQWLLPSTNIFMTRKLVPFKRAFVKASQYKLAVFKILLRNGLCTLGLTLYISHVIFSSKICIAYRPENNILSHANFFEHRRPLVISLLLPTNIRLQKLTC